MIILGIDPGIATTGWGIIKNQDSKIKLQDYGCIKTDAKSKFPVRLDIIHKELKKIINRYKPDVVAVEELFFAKNVKTAINVGHARGVVILAAVESSVPVMEYTPLQVKQALVGYGRAEKRQMQNMLKVLLGLDKIPKPDDASDALAVAFCHINSEKVSRILNK